MRGHPARRFSTFVRRFHPESNRESDRPRQTMPENPSRSGLRTQSLLRRRRARNVFIAVFITARIVTARRIDSARILTTEFHTADDEISKSPYFSGSNARSFAGTEQPRSVHRLAKRGFGKSQRAFDRRMRLHLSQAPTTPIRLPAALKWLTNPAAANLPLAALPCVGHIGLNGAVAEWLKAAVC
jgi:hypothetical protein